MHRRKGTISDALVCCPPGVWPDIRWMLPSFHQLCLGYPPCAQETLRWVSQGCLCYTHLDCRMTAGDELARAPNCRSDPRRMGRVYTRGGIQVRLDARRLDSMPLEQNEQDLSRRSAKAAD